MHENVHSKAKYTKNPIRKFRFMHLKKEEKKTKLYDITPVYVYKRKVRARKMHNVKILPSGKTLFSHRILESVCAAVMARSYSTPATAPVYIKELYHNLHMNFK